MNPPHWMDDRAVAVWRELESHVNIVPAAADSFGIYCDALARYREAAEMVARDGMLIVGDKEQIVRNPAVTLVKEYAALVAASGRRFGL